MKSQQIAVVENQPPLHPAFSIEVEERIFTRLTELSAKEGVPIKTLASKMLKSFLTLHKRELRQLIQNIKKRTFR